MKLPLTVLVSDF